MADERDSMAQRRGDGIGPAGFAWNAREYFVRAAVDEVAGLFVRVMNATAWRRDVYGQAIPNTWPDCWWAFTQLKGHAWTSAEYLWGESDPQRTAQHLATEVIVYGHANFTSTWFYELYDCDGLAERFEFTPSDWPDEGLDQSAFEEALRDTKRGPFRFESRIRDVDLGKVKDGFVFIDSFFREHDAYVYLPPKFSHAEQDESGREIEYLEDPSFDSSDIERADLVQVLGNQRSLEGVR